MNFIIRTILNAVRFRRGEFRRLALTGLVLALCVPALWASGRHDETVTAEGGEVWEHDFDVSGRKKGQHNLIIYARDRAGNEAISGPFNVKVDPNAGLPTARVVYPEANTIIRQHINVLGVAAGRYGVERVLMRLDNGDYFDVGGTEYWSQLIDFAAMAIPDGKHTLYVHAIDSKGAAGPVQSLPFILDTTPPKIELTSHNIGDIITGKVTIRGLAQDPNGIKTMEYSTDGENFNSLSGKKRGQTDFDFSLSINTQSVPDGPLVYYLRAVDNTGVSSVKPYLFFVTNSGPELELYTPVQGEDVFGTFYLSGYAYDKIGLSRLYYEWGRVKEDIEMRPGDPYWNVTLEASQGSAKSIKVSAVDKVGNITSVTCKLEDSRKVKIPILVIDYPPEDVLKTMQNGIPPDMAIYGHIAPGVEPHAVVVDGFGEIEAVSSFRIAPHMLPHGKRAQTLKLTPFASDSAKGAVLSYRYLKEEALALDDSEVIITAPAKNSWQSGHAFTLQGNVINPQNTGLEFRLHPQDRWQSLRLDMEGGFNEEINMDGQAQGPVHLELRTSQYGQDRYPIYHPFNWAASPPIIHFINPTEEHILVWGSKTIMGVVENTVPMQQISYSLDMRNFIDIPFVSRYGKTWFSYFCDFNALGMSRAPLAFRFTDASGAQFFEIPEYTIEHNPPLPVIIVNTPVDDEVFTDAFDISGLAYADVGIHAVYWRILGPRMDTISRGPAGDVARAAAAAFEAYPDRTFNELLTEQNFEIPIDFTMITDGEYIIEIYASDPYGVHSETIARTVKISTEAPETEIVTPEITRYNHNAIMIRGFSSDANIVDNVTLSMDNGNTWQHVELYEDGRWVLALNTAAYVDGIYSGLVRTEDKYGITSFSNVMINIDNTPPELYLTSPQNGQHVGTNMQLMGRVFDNITLKSLTFQIISASNPDLRRVVELSPELVIFDTISLAGFPQDEYIIRLVAKDLAENETIVSRKIVYDADDKAAQVAIFNPLPGEVHTGTIHIVGIVSGSFQPEEVQLLMNDVPLDRVVVERYGIFKYDIPESMLDGEGAYRISAYYHSETNQTISSPDHTVYYSPYGPTLLIESHHDGDVITGRPWLSGRAWMTAAPEPVEEEGEELVPLTRSERRQQEAERKLKNVTVSFDNGRIFTAVKGSKEWKVRMETSELPRGPQPVVVRAQFVNGEEAVRRVMLYVDTTLPQVETISPPEDSRHRDDILVYGTASDNYELASVTASLRPHDKFWYSVPPAIQGLYFDVKGFGATYFDVGLGLSLFNNNVRFQFQFGISPVDGVNHTFAIGGRYVGYVYGVKLLANIFYLPFDYLFGLDWAFYSMNLAIGANFSYFTMDEWRSALFMGAIVAQLDIANIDFRKINPNWKYFRNYALYLEPELWFASSDVHAETKFRMTVGLRINWF